MGFVNELMGLMHGQSMGNDDEPRGGAGAGVPPPDGPDEWLKHGTESLNA